MKERIEEHPSSENKNEHSNLDRLFEMHQNGEMESLLQNFEGVMITPGICRVNGKSEKTMQIGFRYQSINVLIDFFEHNYNMVIYPSGITADVLKELFVEYDYPDGFTLKKLIEATADQMRIKERNRKRYHYLVSGALLLLLAVFEAALLYGAFIEKMPFCLILFAAFAIVMYKLIRNDFEKSE